MQSPFIKQTGKGSFLAKTDIASAFRIIPIRPQDYELLGMFWKGQYYYDKCMPMGCSSSCQTFEMLSTSIEWIAKMHLHISHIIHILDEFFLAAPSYHQCSNDLDNLLLLCDYLGIPVAPKTTLGPVQVLSFAGIELDTLVMEARLPADKLAKSRSLVSALLCRKRVTIREIQSLIDLLNFACSVVVLGRAFLRRLIDLTKGTHVAHHLIRLTKSARADLQMWQQFLKTFSGRSFFLSDIWVSSTTLNLYTDAAGTVGFGAMFGNYWCHGEWPAFWKGLNIILLEFYPSVLSVMLWGHLIQNQRITFYTDYAALVDIINKCTSRDQSMMVYVRKLVLTCLHCNILLRARHVPGIENVLADSLSRLQVDKFKRLAPVGTQPYPTQVPHHLQPEHWLI